jgi:hypothetical protein
MATIHGLETGAGAAWVGVRGASLIYLVLDSANTVKVEKLNVQILNIVGMFRAV